MIINIEKATEAIALNDEIKECIPDGYTAVMIKHVDVNNIEVLIYGEYINEEDISVYGQLVCVMNVSHKIIPDDFILTEELSQCIIKIQQVLNNYH